MSGTTAMHNHGRSARGELKLRGGLTALIVGLSLIGLSFACAAMMRGSNGRPRVHRKVEKRRDESLKQTFPASDSPASQFFDIPVNRL